MFAFILSLLICLCHFSEQKSTPEDATYIAAVAEVNPMDDTMKNLARYTKIIRDASKKKVDIIIFPEKALTTSQDSVEVPINGNLKRFPVPADREDLYDKVLVDLSAAAKKYEMYVVVNLRERVNCTTPNEDEICPGTQVYIFNTNVVFDRRGAVIERAGKYNLFFEPEFTAEVYTNVSTFTTDFNVTFGTVISFDLLFTVPTALLVTQMKLTNIIMTSNWCPEPPFLGTLQTQNAFQFGYNVNFLVAGRNDWENGYSGSGIYSGSAGTLVSIVKNITTYRLLVAEVPKIPGQVTKKYPGPTKVDPALLDGTSTCIDSSLDKFISEPLTDGYQELSYRYQDISCNFIVNITLGKGDQSYVYRTAVFSGVRKFGFNKTGGARACAIISCSGDDIYSCGKRFPEYTKNASATFSELTIIGTAPKKMLDPKTKTYDSTFFQTSLTASLSSIQPKDIECKKKTVGNMTTYTLTLKNFDQEILTFGFWGRKFTDDGKEETTPRIENTGNNVLEPTSNQSSNNSATEKTSQNKFPILRELFAILNGLRRAIRRVFSEIGKGNLDLKDIL